MSKPVILTGLRANNDLHLGSYLGAMLPMAQLQQKYGKTYQINMFIPDLHSFTTPIDHSKLYEQSINNIKLFMASGLDIVQPDTYIYRQSRVPAHSELTIILNCFTRLGELNRMTQFKEKAKILDVDKVLKKLHESASSANTSLDKLKEEIKNLLEANTQEARASVGLYDYPVLMAADILLYGAKYVPVGADQTQHVELARDIAIRMNNKFKRELFVLPESEKEQIAFATQDERLRVRDLLDPTKKMSKSDETGKGVIFLGDSPETGAKKIMSATTDSLGEINYNYEKQPGISNLLDILSALTDTPIKDTVEKYKGQTQYGPLKQDVADTVSNFLTNFQSKLAEVDEKELMDKLEISEAEMNEVANQTLSRVQRAVGLIPAKTKEPKVRAGQLAKPPVVAFTDFAKLDIRMGTVTKATKVPNSDKLIQLLIDIGTETRSVVTGMREFYKTDHFVGKQIPVIVNLKPQTFKDTQSHGMLIAVEGDNGPVLLLPENSVPAGSPIE